MKALYARGNYSFDLREIETPSPKAGEVLVKVKACGLCGTDIHYARDWNGDFAPLGHEISGEVIQTGDFVTGFKTGDKVIVEDVAMCGICPNCKDGNTGQCRKGPNLNGQPGMSEYIAVDSKLLHKFEGMDFVSASLVEPCAVAINCVLNARIPLGGNVAIYGPGPIGLMCVRIAKLMGAASVALIGSSRKSRRGAARLAAGAELGADLLISADNEAAVQELMEYYPEGADSVVVTAPPGTLPYAIRMAKYGGTVSCAGIDLGGKSKVELDINELIFGKVTLKPAFAEPAQKFPAAMRLISKGLLDANKLITHTFSFEEAARIIRESDCGEMKVIKAVLLPDQEA